MTWNRAESIGRMGQLRQDWRALHALRWGVPLLVATLVIACASAPVGSTVPPVATATVEMGFAAEDAAIALPLLVQSERNAAAALDLATLAALWAEDARIVERRDVENPDDDYTWQGRDAILDRYVVAVFPNPPGEMDEPPGGEVAVNGDRATMVNGVDSWGFVWREGRWWIVELVIG